MYNCMSLIDIGVTESLWRCCEMSERNIIDITIIGGGPVGLFTAFYGGMRQATVKIIESMPQLGGQLSALYPEKYIYDVAGFPKVRAQELINNLIEQMDKFEPNIVLNQSVLMVEKQEDDIGRQNHSDIP